MILLIDAGNTRVKVGVLQDGAIQFISAIDAGSANELLHNLQAAITNLNGQIQACTAVSVARPEINQAVQKALSPITVHWVSPSKEIGGVMNSYPDPSQLGADRWVSMIGLTRHFTLPHPPIVLASFGTATTVDTLSPDNVFKGGLILPGVSLMQTSLARGTANLPDAVGALAHFPTDTVSAITSGVIAAQVGAVLRQMKLAHQTHGQRPTLCVTGGAWLVVADELHETLPLGEIKQLPHVVLDGLGVLASTPGL